MTSIWLIVLLIFNVVLIVTLLSAGGSVPLPWSIRMKIALGAAKGLAFLHEEVQRPVIYRDFKTSNILLDAVSDGDGETISLLYSSS